MALKVDTLGPNGEVVMRHLIGKSEAMFWERVDALLTHSAEELRVFAKSRRLVVYGAKVEFAKSIAMHDLMLRVLSDGDWSTAADFANAVSSGFQLCTVSLNYVSQAKEVPVTVDSQLLDQLVAGVRAYARANYDRDGWDFLVETVEDAELRKALVWENGKLRAATVRGAITVVKREFMFSALDSVRRDIQAA